MTALAEVATDAEALRAWANTRLGKTQRLSAVAIVEALPRNAIGKVLKSETAARINRVFTIIFPEQRVAERFFADPAYRAVRAELFEPAVESVTAIAAFDETRPGR